MKSRINIFLILFKVGFLKLSKYVEATLVNLCSSFMFIFVQFFVWNAIIHNSKSIEYSFFQMFSYIIYSQFLTSIYPGGLGKQLGRLVESGDISLYLLKPLSITKQLIYENMGTSIYKFIFTSLPIFMMGIILSKNNLCVNNFMYFLISVCTSYIIFALIDVVFGIIQFYTKSSWGINSLKYAIITLFSGRLLPLGIYPKWCLNVLDSMPFKYLYDVPIQIVIGKNMDFIEKELLWSLIWIIILYVVYKICFHRAIKKITVQGG